MTLHVGHDRVAGRRGSSAPVASRPIAAAALLAVGVSVTLLALVPPRAAAQLALAMVWAAVPGVLLLGRLYRGRPGGFGTALLLGPACGFAVSSLVLLVLWLFGIRHAAVLQVTAPLAGSLLALFAGGLAGPLTPPAITRRDVTAACLVLLLVPLVVARPYSRVGADLPDGRAYRAYFTADFVWAMAVVAEVSKGDVPPRNQFLHGSDLHYYWLPHLWSAAQYGGASPRVRLDSLLLVNGSLLGLAFVAFLYGFARSFVASPAAAALGCTVAVLFTSFEGLNRLLVLWRDGIPWVALRGINIDAVTRWYYGGLPVDGLQRVLLYQPQHHAMAYAVGLTAIVLMVQARGALTSRLMLIVGSLLATSVLMSAFSAIMMTVMAAVYAAVVLVWRRDWRGIVPAALAAAVPLGLAAAAAFALRYVETGQSVVELVVNRMAVNRLWWNLMLSFGPMLLLGSLGLALGAVRRAHGWLALAVIVSVSFVFYFFVNVRDHQDVYVGWRAGHFIFMAGAALAGLALHEIWRAPRPLRAAGIVLVAAVLVAAAPTPIIDLYNTQDIENRSMGPSFRWTTVLTRAEVEALDWIRQRTPPAAVVQVEPHVRGNFTWAYVPAFAERRMAAGLPISMVPLSRYQAASQEVRAIYSAEAADEAHARAARLGVEYLVVGTPEREGYPGAQPMFDARPDLFRPVFRNAEVAIYFVERPLGGAGAVR